MKIYKYYNGKICELEVRETAKMYICEGKRELAFGCMSRFEKCDGWAVTPLEAVQEQINRHLSMRGGLKDRIHKIDSDLGQLRKLEKSYNQAIQADQN